jgi:hypothetical protein
MRAVYFIGYSLLCTGRCVMVVISEEREKWEQLAAPDEEPDAGELPF